MATFAQDPNFETRVRDSFARQNLNRLIGATLSRVVAGEAEIEVPFREDLSQQHGFLHGGIVASIGDAACGYAALSLSPPDAEVLTVEFKINFIAPAKGERVIARGRVTKSGRTLSVCAGDVFAMNGGTETLIATMLATIMVIPGNRSESPPARHGLARHSTSRQARRWCVCRGGRLRQRLREFAGIGRAEA